VLPKVGMSNKVVREESHSDSNSDFQTLEISPISKGCEIVEDKEPIEVAFVPES
jgi:hypothetical protein